MIDANAKATLDAAELARVLGVDRKGVYEATKRGQLAWAAPLTVGRRLLFSRAAVERHLG